MFQLTLAKHHMQGLVIAIFSYKVCYVVFTISFRLYKDFHLLSEFFVKVWFSYVIFLKRNTFSHGIVRFPGKWKS